MGSHLERKADGGVWTRRPKHREAGTSVNGLQTYRSAGLHKELAHRSPVVHGVEGGDLVDSHRRHLEEAGYLVHDADAGEAVLSLAKVE